MAKQNNLDQIREAFGEIEIPANIKQAAEKLDLYQRLQQFATDKSGGAVILGEFAHRAKELLLDVFAAIEKGADHQTLVSMLMDLKSIILFLATWDSLGRKESVYQEIVDKELEKLVRPKAPDA